MLLFLAPNITEAVDCFIWVVGRGAESFSHGVQKATILRSSPRRKPAAEEPRARIPLRVHPAYHTAMLSPGSI